MSGPRPRIGTAHPSAAAPTRGTGSRRASGAALSACSPVGSRLDPTNAVVPAPTAESDSEPSGETVGEIRIRMTVGNQTIEARLHDNPTA